jgi:hypothetical protein
LLTAIFLMEHPVVAPAMTSSKTIKLSRCQFQIFEMKKNVRGFNSQPSP